MEQEIKEKLDRSASNKLDRPTSEMPGKHQPSAFSKKIFASKSIPHMRRICTYIDLLMNMCVLKALGWCFPGISEVGRSRLLLTYIDLLMNIFVMKALGWCIPGISEVGRSRLLLAERSSFFSLISCSALLIIIFFYFAHLPVIFCYSARFASDYFFLFCSFCQLLLDFLLLHANLLFLPNTILNLFATFSSFLCSKLNFLPFPANLPPMHYLRNGSASAFL